LKKALEQIERRYRDLYEKAPNAYFSISAIDGSIIMCNSAALRFLGYARKTMMRMNVFELYADTPYGLPKAKEIFKRFKTGESIENVELQMKRKDGKPVWISLSVEPIRDYDGNITESMSMVIDISARKHAEEALEKRNRELSSLNIIATTINQSLDLNTILTDTLRTVLDMMNLKAGWIFLRDGETNMLTLSSHMGLPPYFIHEEIKQLPEDCIGFHVIKRKEAMIAEDILECPRLTKLLQEGSACHACVPLISKDKVVGVMNVASEEFCRISPEDLNLLTNIGNQVGVAIENATLFKDTQQKARELEEAYEKLKLSYEEIRAEREKTKTLKMALVDKIWPGKYCGQKTLQCKPSMI